MPEALIPVQLLWINFATDGAVAVSLSFNKADTQIMKTRPRSNDDPLISRWLFIRYLIIGIYVGVATVAGYAWWFVFYSGGPQISLYELVSWASYCALSRAKLTLRRRTSTTAPRSPASTAACSRARQRAPPRP
jgi:Ca2+ transporting ATPase